MSEILPNGWKCFYLGENILGDGEHTREELANKEKVRKIKPKRGAKTLEEIVPVLENKVLKEEYEKIINKPKPKKAKTVKKVNKKD